MGTANAAVKTFGLNEENWKKHANPWSVWSRMAAFVVMIAAIFARELFGWWTLAFIGAGIIFMFLNTRIFPGVDQPRRWDEKGIYGEKLWTLKDEAAAGHRKAINLLIGIAGIGLPIMVYGLIVVEAWPTVFGLSLVFVSQLWQIDRFVAIYDEAQRREQRS
jgi:hypothetical protein